MEIEYVIKQLNALMDYGKVNEIQGIVDVSTNAIDAIERLTAEVKRLEAD